MVRRVVLTLALAAVAALTAPSLAAGRTLVVGDGGASCHDARYSTIQGALDATRRGDQVVVCPGTYHENLQVNADRIRLVARKRHAAVIQPAQTDRTVVDMYGKGTLFRGFTVSGTPPSQGCGDRDTDAVVAWAGATVDYNRVVDLGCRSFRFGIDNAFAVEQGRFSADHNYVEGTTDSAVRVVGRPLATANSNTIKRSGAGIQFGYYAFGGAGQGLVQNNTIEDTRAGVFASGYEQESFRLRVRGNRLRRNDVGIDISEVGVGVGSDQPRFARVEGNTVLDSTGDGIRMNSASGYLLRNRSLGSGGFDCREVFPAFGRSVWANDNVGRTDSPSNLCRAP